MQIDCLKIANNILSNVKKELTFFTSLNIQPKIVFIKLSNNLINEKIMNIQINKAHEFGIKTEIVSHLKTEEELTLYLDKLNRSKNVSGYLIQFPLPEKFNLQNVISHISHQKDLNGLSYASISTNLIGINTQYVQPIIAKAIWKVIENQKYYLSGKHVVIVNNDLLIGKPIAQMLLNCDATVTICNAKTKNLTSLTNTADLIITAINKIEFLKKRAIKKNAFVIDASINYLNNELYGDVDFKQVKNQAKYITSIPNGIDKIAIAILFSNLVDLLKLQNKNLKE